MTESVVILTTTNFPGTSAYANRLRGFAEIFRYLGFKVHIISDGREASMPIARGLPPDEFISIETAGRTQPRMRDPFVGYRSLRLLDRHLALLRPTFIVAGNPYDRFAPLRRLATRHGVPLIVELCEWFDPTNFRGGRASPFYQQHQVAVVRKYARSDGVIAISTLLRNHFDGLGVPTILVPTILDVQRIPFGHVQGSSRLSLIQAGTGLKSKEDLANIAAAVGVLNRDGKPVDLDLFGYSRQAVLASLGGHDRAGSIPLGVRIHERIPFDQLMGVYGNVDFSVIIRPQRRSSDAGFPTKLAESLATGTPVISNRTGDIPQYISHGDNGYLVDDDLPDSLVRVLYEALAIDRDGIGRMRQSARTTAERHFDFRCYVVEMGSFLDEVLRSHRSSGPRRRR